MTTLDVDKNGVVISVSKVYADVNKERGPSWYNHKSLTPVWNTPENYYIVKKTGRGKYSTVFKGYHKKHKQCAIKVLVPLEPRRYLREIKILQNLQNEKNIVKLYDLIMDPMSGVYSFVFEWVNFVDWRSLYDSFTPMDIRIYVYKLLEALDASHSNGIMHRDIKPQNIAIDKETRKLRLLDWGLADFYHPGQKYNSHVATRVFKAPELLICYPYYDYSMDIWSAGLTFSIMLFKSVVFEYGEDDHEQLFKIANVVGGKGLINYANSLNVQLDEKTIDTLNEKKGVDWESFINEKNESNCSEEAIDLLKKMMVIDHRNRITAKDAKNHPYFKPLLKKKSK